MRLSFGLVLSILFHVGLACVALFWVTTPAVHVDMDRQVYTVDLVSLAPPPARVPVVESVPATAPQQTAPVVEAPAQAPVEVKAAPVVEAKPEPKPEPQPEVKPEPKPEPKPEAKEISPKKVEKKTVVKKEAPAKPPEPKEPPKPKKTVKQLLAEGLAAAKAEAQKEQQGKERALAKELAALKKQEGGDKAVYAHGGQAGGVQGGVAGGTGSGLSEVYSLIVGSAIKKHWRYPSFAGEVNLVASVEVVLAPDGKILSSRVLTSSGNTEFDSSALRAITETEYVEPPKVERDRVLRINFNSQELSE